MDGWYAVFLVSFWGVSAYFFTIHVSLLKSSLAFLFFQLPCFPENIETPLSLGPTSEYDLQAPNAPNESIKEIHPGRLTWNQQVTHLERKLIFQTSMIMFHVHLQGCTVDGSEIRQSPPGM